MPTEMFVAEIFNSSLQKIGRLPNPFFINIITISITYISTNTRRKAEEPVT